MSETTWDEQIRNTAAVRAVGLEEFHAAIAGFTAQLDAALTGGDTDGFCVGFYTVPHNRLFASYKMVGHACYVRFEAGDRGGLEVWIESHTEEDQLVVLRWASGTWVVSGPGVSSRIYDDGPTEEGSAPLPATVPVNPTIAPASARQRLDRTRVALEDVG